MSCMAVASFMRVLQLRRGEGFSSELRLEDHIKRPYVAGKHPVPQRTTFRKQGLFNYPLASEQVDLVEERVGGRLLYWGRAEVMNLSLFSNGETFGHFKIVTIYDPFYMLLATMNEFPFERAYVLGERLLRLVERHHGVAQRALLEERIRVLQSR